MALIVLTVSRRIGHASPVVAIKVYPRPFTATDKRGQGDQVGAGNGEGTEIPISGGNSAFRPSERRVKCLIINDGAVAEWLKAAVC